MGVWFVLLGCLALGSCSSFQGTYGTTGLKDIYGKPLQDAALGKTISNYRDNLQRIADGRTSDDPLEALVAAWAVSGTRSKTGAGNTLIEANLQRSYEEHGEAGVAELDNRVAYALRKSGIRTSKLVLRARDSYVEFLKSKQAERTPEDDASVPKETDQVRVATASVELPKQDELHMASCEAFQVQVGAKFVPTGSQLRRNHEWERQLHGEPVTAAVYRFDDPTIPEVVRTPVFLSFGTSRNLGGGVRPLQLDREELVFSGVIDLVGPGDTVLVITQGFEKTGLVSARAYVSVTASTVARKDSKMLAISFAVNAKSQAEALQEMADLLATLKLEDGWGIVDRPSTRGLQRVQLPKPKGQAG